MVLCILQTPFRVRRKAPENSSKKTLTKHTEIILVDKNRLQENNTA
jgi:hypothetical protein